MRRAGIRYSGQNKLIVVVRKVNKRVVGGSPMEQIGCKSEDKQNTHTMYLQTTNVYLWLSHMKCHIFNYLLFLSFKNSIIYTLHLIITLFLSHQHCQTKCVARNLIKMIMVVLQHGNSIKLKR